jgi:hypothetical protein
VNDSSTPGVAEELGEGDAKMLADGEGAAVGDGCVETSILGVGLAAGLDDGACDFSGVVDVEIVGE